jgi:transporter family-2 protein
MYGALLASALLVGCLLAVQASVNLQLTKAVGTPYGASTLQLSLAAGLLLVLAVAAGAIGAARLVPEVPVWLLFGGLFSPLYITSGILLFPRLGALAAVGLFVTGQMFASLGLDLLGLLEVPRRSVTAGVALGAAAVLVGIVMIVRGQRAAAPPGGPVATSAAPPAPATAPGGRNGHAGRGGLATATATVAGGQARPAVRAGRAGWIALGIVAGAGLPVQGAVNARLRSELAEPLAVATISFTVAATAIALVLLGLLALRATPRPRLRPLARMPWWGWLGGGCAAAYVTATFLLIPEIGAATTVALTVTGQQLASAAIDGRGMFRMPTRALTRARTTGLVLLVAGAALVQLG